MDRNLTMQLVYGVLRNRQYLDRIIELLSRTPIRKLNPFVHQATAIGLYQIFYLERIPESAAVNEAVESCRIKKIHKRLLGFVNGVLRQAIRQRERLRSQAATSEQGDTIVNHPRWLVDRWCKNFGVEETERICRINSLKPLSTLRVNSNRIDRTHFLKTLEENNILSQEGTYSPEAITLIDFHGPLHSIPGYDEGHFSVQDEAAQLVTPLLGPFTKGGTYLDGCAGLGGKTGHLLQFGEKFQFTVHAVEPDRFRSTRLRENINRVFPDRNPESLHLHQGYLHDITLSDTEQFSGILIDAPCSGTGVIGKHPDIRWNRCESDIFKNQTQQLELLSHGAQLLAPGGILVYATCSIEPEENLEVINVFLSTHKDFCLTDCSEYLPKAAHRFVQDNCFSPLPEKGLDGFFAARLTKK